MLKRSSAVPGFSVLPIAISVLIPIGPATAATTFYSDRTLFENALGTIVTDDYSNPGYVSIQNDAAMSAVLGETDYTSTGFSNLNIVSSERYCAGCNGSFLLSFGSTSVGNSIGVYGVGFNFLNTDSPLYTAYVTYGDGSTENIPLPFAGNPPVEFYGITSDILISSIAFGLPDGGTTRSGAFAIDNLTIGASPEPVPAPLPVFAAVAALGVSRQLRNRIKSDGLREKSVIG